MACDSRSGGDPGSGGEPDGVTLDRTLSIAPMLGWTDRHERYLLRLLTRRALLYTEMVSCAAIVLGDRHELLDFDPVEHPVALQLGGSDPAQMAEAARLGAEWGYDEINMNVGCPSERGLSNRFGACLMAEPETVSACVQAMREAVDIPVTVKCRIGIDDRDSYEHLVDFVSRVAEAGCETFVVHARKAWLEGLSPKQNRSVPPLRYEDVHRLKREFPHLEIVINGGLRDWTSARAHLGPVDGVMIGRQAYEDPYFLATADRDLFGDPRPIPTRREVLEAFLPYAERQVRNQVGVAVLARHLLGLYQGVPRSRAWRRYLSGASIQRGAGAEVLREALEIAEGARRPG